MTEPVNSFLLFCQDYRSIFATCNPTFSNCEVTTLLAKQWKQVSPETREQYQLKATKLRREFHFRNPDYTRKPKNSEFQELMFDFKITSNSQSTTKPTSSPQVSHRNSEMKKPPSYETRRAQTYTQKKAQFQTTRRTDSCPQNTNSSLYRPRAQAMNTYHNQNTSYYQYPVAPSYCTNQPQPAYNPPTNQSFYSHLELPNSDEELYF